MRGEIFLNIFLIGLVFNWMGMFFLRAEALGAEQPIGADASVRERDEGDGMECPGKERRGTRWHRGDVKKVRVWLQRCYCSPLRYRKSKVPQELRILLAVSSHTERWAEWACRDRIATNTGKDGAGRGKKKKLPNKKKYNCPHRSKKSPKGQQTPSPGLRLV